MVGCGATPPMVPAPGIDAPDREDEGEGEGRADIQPKRLSDRAYAKNKQRQLDSGDHEPEQRPDGTANDEPHNRRRSAIGVLSLSHNVPLVLARRPSVHDCITVPLKG